MTGTQTGTTNKGDEIVMTFADYGDFQSQITVPVIQKDPTDTLFGTNCTQDSDGVITCLGTPCSPDDPKCIEIPSTQGQYVSIFTMGEGKYSRGSICVYSSTASNPARTYDPEMVTFDAQDICASLKMKPIYDINISQEVIGEPICERKTNTLSLDFSYNKFTGLLPNIVTTNSATWQELNDMNLEA